MKSGRPSLPNKAIVALFCGVFSISSAFAGDVEHDGSYSTSKPIVLPDGTNDVQPSLSLNYNSNGGNGPLGVGWSLGGLPSITRMNYGNGVKYAGGDTYVGPEGRLVNMGGSTYHAEKENWTLYVAVGTCGDGPCSWNVYDSSGNKWVYGGTADSRIEAIGQGASVRVWALNSFTDPDGLSYTVSYNENTNGGGNFYPNTITYTQGGTLSSFHTVEFVWEMRSDVQATYGQSAVVKNDQRLKTILVKSAGALVRKYELAYTYAASTFRSRLTSITEYGADGTSTLPATTFTYFDTSTSPIPGTFTSTPNTASASDGPVYYVDVNGDGRDDMVQVNTVGVQGHIAYSQAGGTFNPAWDAILGTGTDSGLYTPYFADVNGDGRVDIIQIRSDSTNGSWVGLNTGSNFQIWTSSPMTPGVSNGKYYFADVNGDGKADMIQMRKTGGVSSLWFATAAGSYNTTPDATINTDTGNGMYEFYFADVNGDGKSDILGTRTDGILGLFIGHSTGSGFAPGVWTTTPNVTSLYYGQLYFVDVNGDGRADMVQIGKDLTSYLWYSVGTGTYNSSANPSPPHGYDVVITTGTGAATNGGVDVYVPFFADVNGDGRTDLIQTRADSSSGMWVGLNNGVGFQYPWSFAPMTTSLGQGAIGFADVTGDGADDFVQVATGSTRIAISNATVGSNWAIDRLESISDGIGGSTNINYWPLGNFDNAVLPSATTCGKGTAVGYGQECGIPNSSHRKLVAWVNVYTGNGDAYYTDYDYYNGRFYPGTAQTQEDLGFERVTKRVNGTDQTITYFRQVKPFQRMAYQEDRLDGAGNYIGITTFGSGASGGTVTALVCTETGCTTTTNPDAAPMKINVGTERNYVIKGNSTSWTPYLYYVDKVPAFDTYGNVISITETAYDPAGVAVPNSSKYTQSTVKNQANNPDVSGLRVIGLVYDTKTCTTPACTTVIAQTRNYFDNNTTLGALASTRPFLRNTKSEQWIGGTTWAATTRLFDTYGNVTRITDPRGLSVTTAYDTTFAAHVTSETDACVAGSAACNTTTTTPDARGWDVPGGTITATDPNGLKVESVTDTFGRPTFVLKKNASGTLLEKLGYTYGTGLVWADGYYKETCSYATPGTFTTQICSRTYMDALGRTFKTTRPDGTQVNTDYDSEGRVYRTSEPFTTGGTPAYWTTFTYDNQDRVIQTTHPDGTTTSSAYNDQAMVPGSVTMQSVTNGRNYTTRTWYNEKGQPVQVTDGLGTTGSTATYSYDALGRLTSVSAPGGGTTTLAYDALGRKTSTTESNTGTTTIAYSDAIASGSPGYAAPGTAGYMQIGTVTQSNPNATTGTVTAVYTYDAKGRVATITSPDGSGLTAAVTTYTYEETNRTNSKGRKTTESRVFDGVTVTKNHDYGIRGEVATTTITVSGTADGQSAAKSIVLGGSIDEVGRPSTVTYPDGSVATMTYDTAGRVTNIAMGGVNYAAYSNYSSATKNNLGRTNPGTITYANGVVTDYTYRADTGRLNTLLTKKGTTNLINLSYAFDNNGNVQSITDSLTPALSETYAYDAFDRLTSAVRPNDGPKTFTYGYDTAGNLTNKATLDASGATVLQRTQTFAANTHRITHDGVNTITYNANGTRQAKGLWTYTYSGENDLRLATNNGTVKERNYLDASGDRMLKVYYKDASTRYRTYYAGPYEIREKWVNGVLSASQTTKYVNGIDGNPVASVTSGTAGQTLGLLNTKGAEGQALASVANPRTLAAPKADEAGTLLRVLLLAVLPLMALGLFCRYVLRLDRRAFRRAGALGAVLVFSVVSGCSNGADLVDPLFATFRNAILNGDTSMGLPGGTYFFHRTHIGSSSVITDSTGVQVEKIVYEPYGAVDPAKSTNASASMNVTKMFTGQEYDPETSLYNYKARYYDPATGTFTSPDSLVPGSGTQDYNRYMYTNGNPVRFTDPTGHMADAEWDGWRTSTPQYYHSPAGRTGYQGGSSSSSYGPRYYGSGYRPCAGYACGTSSHVRSPTVPVYQAYRPQKRPWLPAPAIIGLVHRTLKPAAGLYSRLMTSGEPLAMWSRSMLGGPANPEGLLAYKGLTWYGKSTTLSSKIYNVLTLGNRWTKLNPFMPVLKQFDGSIYGARAFAKPWDIVNKTPGATSEWFLTEGRWAKFGKAAGEFHTRMTPYMNVATIASAAYEVAKFDYDVEHGKASNFNIITGHWETKMNGTTWTYWDKDHWQQMGANDDGWDDHGRIINAWWQRR